MAAVWDYAQAKGGERLLLLAIADNAKDDGTGAWPSLTRLCAKTKFSERNVRYLLRKLEEAGELVIQPGAGPHGCNLYRVVLAGWHPEQEDMSQWQKLPPAKIAPRQNPSQGGAKSVAGRGKDFTEGGQPIAPDPSVNHQLEPSREPSDVDVQFARFWAAYPKRKKKQEAQAWFARRRPSAQLVDEMIAALERAVLSEGWQKEDGRFIPLPVSWLNGRRWEDEEEVCLPTIPARPTGVYALDEKSARVLATTQRVLARRQANGHA